MIPSMFKRKIGINLSALLVWQIRKAGAQVEVIKSRLSKPVIIRIAGSLFYIKYANLNKAGNWYFGFYPKDIHDEQLCHYAVLLCGDSQFARTYLLPFKSLTDFVREGTLIDSSTRSPQYQAHIFPHRGFIMKVTGRDSSELQMTPFQLHIGQLDNNFVTTFLGQMKNPNFNVL